ncbi:GntR family transcriptional regulator [Tamaricihabitans halophyticus]|uniref:GntR family transcriptional regulator n=1 Tax=Tamaricihabitans halophyticus TaxID=1262583 RepID=A0A4R2PXM0_9PSEU|nr:GntR family transcriptional regulator [Tamaricihabitans halophyticus]TCP40759.1 GntR family transcriptional regulator [Tamaricihabitans halophyticus]
MPALPALPPESRRDWILRNLRERIASGELAAGERLVERDISADYGISRGPVREAIMVLERDGLIIAHPYRGAVVAEITQQEIAEILVPIRLVIEKVAFRDAAKAGNEELLATLDGIIQQMESAAEPLDARRLADLDVAFHEAVIAAAQHTQSLQIWRTIQPRVRAYFLRDAPHHDSPHAVVEQHRALLDVLRSGDLQRTETEIAKHIGIYLD